MQDIDRDRFMTPEEAVEYGVCDKVLDRAPEGAARRPAEENGDEDKP